jgi:hypothetical protein
VTTFSRLLARSTLLALPLLLACASSLPEYAAPKRLDVDYADLASRDTIRYRTLTREDFRGTRPPEAFAAVADRLGAATCGHLVLPPAKLSIRSRTDPGGDTEYEVVVESLDFYAEMDRSCSWWNPNFVGLKHDYVLEHEQIHFALFEIQARRLRAGIPALKEHVRSTGSSAQEVQAIAQQKLNEVLEENMAEVMDRNREFDEDTSLGYNPKKQKEWLARVSAELAEHGP